ncbi:MAG: hypothetical protein PHF37_09610 [Phycisphaerae bacterium]|nr:hypothetical protein [Phycisphaerae bacterium]
MSSYGYRKAQLSPERLKELQQERTRREAQGLLKTCQKKLSRIADPVMKELLEKQIQSFQSQISGILNQLQSSPQTALNSAEQLAQQINTAFSQAKIRVDHIQLEQLKKEANSSLGDATGMLRHIHNPIIQQLIGPKIRQLQPQIKKISELIDTDPSKANYLSKDLQHQIKKMLDTAQKEFQKEAKIKAAANIKLEQVGQQLEASMEEASQIPDEQLRQIRKLIDTAAEHYQQGQFKQVDQFCQQASNLLKQASQKSFDETIRKEVVQGLLTTLAQMGFVVQPPFLDGDQQENRTVRLSGRLPSGKMASFNVHLDGRMDFDLEGYQGKACAKELEKIDEILNQRFFIKLSENKITWKNPDKIAKTAMQLPTGNRNINLH